MSTELWVTTPGGVSVATDQIMEVMDRLQPVLTISAEVAVDLEGIRRHLGPLSHRASVEAREFVEWCRWLASSLDTYCRQVAQMERVRVDLWSKPFDRAMATFAHYGTGRAHARGANPRSSRDDLAAALIPEDYSAASRVEVVSRSARQAVSLTLAERIARIPNTDTPIRIERYALEDGSHHTEVFIAGTGDWAMTSAESSFDMGANLALVAGVPAASVVATRLALTQAGVTPRDRVVFIGHSQGGAVAATLAESGQYQTAGLITVGAPTGSLPVSGDYPALIVEHTDDAIPGLGGVRVPTNAYVVRTSSNELPGDVVGAHDKATYLATAERIDQSPSRRLTGLFAHFPRVARGMVMVFSARPL